MPLKYIIEILFVKLPTASNPIQQEIYLRDIAHFQQFGEDLLPSNCIRKMIRRETPSGSLSTTKNLKGSPHPTSSVHCPMIQSSVFAASYPV
ncbi:hypothetical protein AVEN_215028-1 [Araneus ventricosus]|uniref:Uncharacterized protein n=1 Tax=Araneus ventricosus TaxID=182803 RepID=A0A4Y2SZ91_ARAVE|nr:hypothetical protein AVEN_215028-1 [Araneus ventricosus]